MWFEHLKALLVLAWTGLVAYVAFIGDILLDDEMVFLATSVIIGFYFGERKSTAEEEAERHRPPASLSN